MTLITLLSDSENTHLFGFSFKDPIPKILVGFRFGLKDNEVTVNPNRWRGKL